jgi:hypothetical protein
MKEKKRERNKRNEIVSPFCLCLHPMFGELSVEPVSTLA